MHTHYQSFLQQPGWTALERAAYEATASSRLEPPGLFSPLLRRIRATAGPGPVNSTDAWSTMAPSVSKPPTERPALSSSTCSAAAPRAWGGR